jgi:hypothetical protein
MFLLDLHARLAPVAGTKTAGKFQGVLSRMGSHGITPGGKVAVPPNSRWQLTWSLSLPQLDEPMTASLRIGSSRSSVHLTRVLCRGCSTSARGMTSLSARQVRSISKANGMVVVRAGAATLRGRVKVSVNIPVTTKN